MATNLADLRVGLLLNDASFRSNITDATQDVKQSASQEKQNKMLKMFQIAFILLVHQLSRLRDR